MYRLVLPVSDGDAPEHYFEGLPDGRMVNILQNKHTIDILLYINSHGTVKEVDIRNDVTKSYDTSNKRLNMLRAAGLVDCMYPDANVRGHKARMWWLTAKGRAVARILIILNRGMTGEVDLENEEFEDFINRHVMPRAEYDGGE